MFNTMKCQRAGKTAISLGAGFILLSASLCLTSIGYADGHLSPAHKNAYVYIGWPNDGEVIHKRKFRVWFGLRHMGVSPAGVPFDFSGHHHLLIDTELPPLDEEIPADKHHLHFGAGQTETEIELEPGVHTLQLLFADYTHTPHDPPIMSKRITITVK